jgi:AcrR family transcriptional regulator
MDVREQLLNAAVKVFADAGFRGATTRRIAQVADVNEVTLFRHFGSKEGLIMEAIYRSLETLRTQVRLPDEPVDPPHELLEWTSTNYAFILQHHRLIKAAMAEAQTHPDMSCVGQRVVEHIDVPLQRYLRRLQVRGWCDDGFDPVTAAGVLSGVVFADAMGRSIHPHCYAFPESEAPRRYLEFFLRALYLRSEASAPAQADEPLMRHA